MQYGVSLVLAVCAVAVAAALVAALLTVRRAGQRAERVLALVEREIDRQVPPIVASLRELTGELKLLSQDAREELDRVGQITARVQELTDGGARLLTALSGLTRVGQLVGIAAGIKTGVDVFFHRLRNDRGDGHGT